MTRFDPTAELILVTSLLQHGDEVAVLRLALDTGANFSGLRLQVFEDTNQNVPPEIELMMLATANGIIETPLIEVDSLSALGDSLSQLRVAVHSLPDSFDIDGVLGLDFLRGHRLTLDFRVGEIELV